MKINCISASYFGVSKTIQDNSQKTQSPKFQNFGIELKKTKKGISFGNRPWVLNFGDFGVPQAGMLSAKQAITLYEQLKLGNYLDIGDDRFNFDECDLIRKSNLSFLDNVYCYSDRKNFIKYYQKLTGFPDLQLVSQKIKKEFVNAIEKSEQDLYFDEYKVLLAGYDGVCSVGRGNAFPGSDLDNAYVILKGAKNPSYDVNVVNDFKRLLWEKTDQRILSYNHDEAAFPQVYTKNQIEGLTKAIDRIDAQHKRLQINNEIRSDVDRMQATILNKLETGNTVKYYNDYVRANPYWVEYSKQFPISDRSEVNLCNPSRENIKNVGFTLETIREGEILKGSRNSLDLHGTSYQAANLSQLAALKNMPDMKPKRIARNSIAMNFSIWKLDQQFRFIKTLIESACANNRKFSLEFEKYFSRGERDLFAPLIKALMG